MNLTDFSMGFGSVFSLVSDRLVLVELFKHPHVLLLQYRNSIFKLPGGRLRPGESDIEGLKRKLASKLSVNENVLVSGLEVRTMDSCLQYCSIFFFSVQECLKLFLGRLALHQQFFVPKNFKLLAVPLSQIHENEKVKKY
ncbi:hypothetical protein HID58_075103 [Brassica napus]|uniref:Nudix hydrolase domain-containing protein n=1 Tax=Brassica napus TaxID=3708 RepID=A0ABQ7YIV0_BRANA|nr:hypothetical protein HID58_075103 [Brassica napus]